jgi:hypothetical protein
MHVLGADLATEQSFDNSTVATPMPETGSQPRAGNHSHPKGGIGDDM